MKLAQSINNTSCFELLLGKHFDESYKENQSGAWNRSYLWLLEAPERNWESPELSVHTFKSVCRTTLEASWGKLQILLGMKLTTDVTLPILLEKNNK